MKEVLDPYILQQDDKVFHLYHFWYWYWLKCFSSRCQTFSPAIWTTLKSIKLYFAVCWTFSALLISHLANKHVYLKISMETIQSLKQVLPIKVPLAESSVLLWSNLKDIMVASTSLIVQVVFLNLMVRTGPFLVNSLHINIIISHCGWMRTST